MSATIGVWITAGVLASCVHEDEIENTDSPKSGNDVTAPKITLHRPNVDITGVEKIIISGSELYVGDLLVASWKDDVSKTCKVKMMFNGSDISSGEVASKEWTLTLTVTDGAGNHAEATVKLVMEVVFPDLTVVKPEVSVFGGVEVEINDSQLLIGGEVVASWSDKHTDQCKVSLSFGGKEVKSGDKLSMAGILTLTVTNNQEKSSQAEITLVNEANSGEATIDDMQVGMAIDLLAHITFVNGATLVKTEIEQDSQRTEIYDPHNYIPEFPGMCSFIFTVTGMNWNTAEVKVDNLTIKPLDYKSMAVKNIQPVDILPIIWQVEIWDKNVYKHIEHLRLAEATRIRDMMWEYGAGNHSNEEYQKLMMRLNTGITAENPWWYDNYEIIWWQNDTPTDHANAEQNILNTLIDHTNFKVAGNFNRERYNSLAEFVNNNPNSINIFWNSASTFTDDKATYEKIYNKENLKNLCNSKNFIIFVAWTNISTDKNKSYNGEYEADESWMYSLASLANSNKNTQPNSHLLVTIATDKEWDIDQTNEKYGSKYPIWFANNVLFSGHAFPYLTYSINRITWESWKYATSFTNYVNVAMADLCFQMFAEVKDVDELLEMMRSTALTDYIRFDLNGDGDTDDVVDGQPETQPLQLINPAWLIQKYLIPSVPGSIRWGENIALDKGYYHGAVFDIPGAEVSINGEWIPFNDSNKDIILDQNPMTLEWRLNGNLLRKLGYNHGDTVNGQLIVVDDQWNGLNLNTDVSVRVE